MSEQQRTAIKRNRPKAAMPWHERLGRALVQHGRMWDASTQTIRPRVRHERIASAVGSWLLWGGYRRLRQNPRWYFEGIAERTCQRLAVRWYPEPSDDWEDCGACSISEDECIYHQGINTCAAYVMKNVSPDVAAALFPED